MWVNLCWKELLNMKQMKILSALSLVYKIFKLNSYIFQPPAAELTNYLPSAERGVWLPDRFVFIRLLCMKSYPFVEEPHQRPDGGIHHAACAAQH